MPRQPRLIAAQKSTSHPPEDATQQLTYSKARKLVNDLGGTMIYVQKGLSPYGAWIICLDDKVRIFRWQSPILGRQFWPLDSLYEGLGVVDELKADADVVLLELMEQGVN